MPRGRRGTHGVGLSTSQAMVLRSRLNVRGRDKKTTYPETNRLILYLDWIIDNPDGESKTVDDEGGSSGGSQFISS